MDFKVAGTKEGVTALQMDIKVQGITAEIMESALEKAKNARMHILEKMNDVISSPKELSDNTPAMKKITVHQDKIKEIIGKGGAVIKGMQADTGASVDVNDDGVQPSPKYIADRGDWGAMPPAPPREHNSQGRGTQLAYRSPVRARPVELLWLLSSSGTRLGYVYRMYVLTQPALGRPVSFFLSANGQHALGARARGA